jgi:hypothetical protein
VVIVYEHDQFRIHPLGSASELAEWLSDADFKVAASRLVDLGVNV